MILNIRAFKNPYFDPFCIRQKGESSYQKGESSSQVSSSKAVASKTFKKSALARLQTNLTARVLFRIKSPEMIEFVGKLAVKLKQKKCFPQAEALELILNELLEQNEHDLFILKLAIVNKKNPIIRILRSLDSKKIDELIKIPVPEFFPNFFKELKFYVKVDQINHQKSPVRGIQGLISFSKELTEGKETAKAMKVLETARKAAHKKTIKFEGRIDMFRDIAYAFLDMGSKERAVAVLAESIECISEYAPTEKQQVKASIKIATDLIHIESWDLLVELLNLFSKTSYFKLEDKKTAFEEIFQYMLNGHGLNKALELLYQIKNCPEKDLILEQLADILSSQPGNFDDATELAQLIKNPKIKARALEMISQKSLVDAVQELNVEDSPVH